MFKNRQSEFDDKNLQEKVDKLFMNLEKKKLEMDQHIEKIQAATRDKDRNKDKVIVDLTKTNHELKKKLRTHEERINLLEMHK